MAHVPYVNHRGPEDSPFVIVGEAPGIQEMKLGRPFVGPSGLVLDAAMKQFEVSEYPEPYVTNVVPHMINSATKDQALLAGLTAKYRDELIAQISAHPRRVVLALGAVALWALTGNTSLRITRERGKIFPFPHSEFGVVASTHPAFLLRGGGSLRQFKCDVAQAINIAKGGMPTVFTPPTWEILDSKEKVEDFVRKVQSHKGLIAGDIETHGFSFRLGHILVAGFTLDGKHVYLIPGRKSDMLPEHQGMIQYLDPIWDPKLPVRYCWHNGKFDIKFFWHVGQQARVDEDTMLLSYSLEETGGVHDLETVSADWLQSPNWKGVLDQYLSKKSDSYDKIPYKVLFQYAAYDIANTYNLWNVMRPRVLADARSNILYTKTLIPASDYLAKIETNGLLVDMDRVASNEAAMSKEASGYEEEINKISRALTGREVNPRSPVQLKQFLYNELGLPSKDKSTGVDVLMKLPAHPAVTNLLKYRKVFKGLSTYVIPAREHAADDGRVHQSYLLHGTATGRLACRDPNVQNIPRNPMLRGQFIPAPGYVYIEVDLNQAELRSLACLSGDDALCAVYTTPGSAGLHEELRRELYGMSSDWSDMVLQKYIDKWYIREEEHKKAVARVVEEQKMRCKNVNFGIVYGITPFGLAEQIEDSAQEAARMLAGWAKKFPTAWGFIEKCRNAPLRNQNLVTVFGHKKRFTIVTPETLVNLKNEAANFPHQSTASTITLHGGMRTIDRLRNEFDTRIVNTVHDSILAEVPDEEATIRQVCRVLCDELEQVPVDWGITRIPFKAEAKVGRRWGSLIDLEKYFEAEKAEGRYAA